MTASIHILNGTSLSLRDLENLVKTVRNIFNLPVFARNEIPNLDQAYDPIRRQFNSTVILAQTLLLNNPNNNKLVSLVDVDLYVPILTFVFGEAQLNGTAAIVSTHRLSNLYYGLPPNQSLMLSRLEKEVVHELGHTFGLTHCRQFECVMRSSTYSEEIDHKKIFLCESCNQKLKEKKDQTSALQSRGKKEDLRV